MTRCISIIVFALLIFNVLHAQDQHQRRALHEFSRQASEAYSTERKRTLQLADSLKIPIRISGRDGRFFELQGFSPLGIPLYYTTHNLSGASLIKTNELWNGTAGGNMMEGNGLLLGMWDGGIARWSHREFENRLIAKDAPQDEQVSFSFHATHVAGTLMAAGIREDARGMAPKAVLHAYEWNNDLAEMAAEAAEGLKVSQHSYGTVAGWRRDNNKWYWYGTPLISLTTDYRFGYYDQNARAWDQLASQSPEYLIVRSAGNDRGNGPEPGTTHFVWDGGDWIESDLIRDKDGGEDGYDCIPGAANAKNLLLVGAVDVQSRMASFSSWGPTDDGRIKPDIVAKGVGVLSSNSNNDASYSSMSGTSMSGPMVSGSAILLRGLYEKLQNQHKALWSSTLKGLILHSAQSIDEEPGPNYRSGWGLMNTAAAAALIEKDYYSGSDFLIHQETLYQGDTLLWEVHATGEEPLSATIVWTDPEGVPLAPALNHRQPMLVNDLDLRIFSEDHIHHPWRLDPENPANPADRGDNRVDNVEQVYIEDPDPDKRYTLIIRHKGLLASGSQQVSLILSGIAPAAVIPPLAFDATTLSYDSVKLTWKPNPQNQPVILLSGHNPQFEGPGDGMTYLPGDEIFDGIQVLYVGTDTSFVHSMLEGNTSYHYHIYSIGTENTYSPVRKAQTTTLCGYVSLLPYVQFFKDKDLLPGCWETEVDSAEQQGWLTSNSAPSLIATLDDYIFAKSGENEITKQQLISPVFDLRAYSELRIRFKHSLSVSPESQAIFSYSLDSGNTWTPLKSWNANISETENFQHITSAMAGADKVRFRWTYEGTGKGHWAIGAFQLIKNINAIDVGILPERSGLVNGAGPYETGSGISLQALARPGWQFLQWENQNQTISKDNPMVFTVSTGDTTFTARFIRVYDISAWSRPEGMGSVEGGGKFIAGEEIQLTAIPESGYRFNYWSERNKGEISRNAVLQFEVENDRFLTAHFEAIITSLGDVPNRQSLLIFPNPASEFIEVSYPHQGRGSLRIFDASGRCVHTQGLDETKPGLQKLPVRTFAKGLYLLRIHSGNYNEAIRFQIQ